VKSNHALPLLVLAACAATAGRAQDFGELGDITVERLRPSLDREGIVNVESGSVGQHLDFDIALWGGYGANPLTFSQVEPDGTVTRLGIFIEHRAGMSLVGALSLFDWVQLGAELPVVVYQGGGLFDTLGGTAFGVSDLRLSPKIRILRRQDVFVDVAVVPALTLPTAFPQESFTGAGSFCLIPEVIVSTVLYGVKLGANADMRLRLRPETTVLRHEMTLRGGVGYDFRELLDLPFDVNLSLATTTALLSPFAIPTQNPTELLGSVAWDVFGPLQVFAGGGWGLNVGYGLPDWRVFAGVRFGVQARDRDGDGIPDRLDACPDVPEDKDEYMDTDGCPDPDNDGDGILDVDDKCPNVVGVVENAGCPKDDKDQDGIVDGEDRCPTEAGPADNGGCPYTDKDGDGIYDHVDKCPDEKGTAENAGCPWPDQDKDGIPDRDDKCIDVPEDDNGYEDEDGCPDNKRLVVVTTKTVDLAVTVFFETDSAKIKRESRKPLRAVAQVVSAMPEGTRIRVEGHTDSQGDAQYNLELSQRRAEAVRELLIQEGVPAARLDAQGFGPTQPVAENTTSSGRAKNRRVVFRILTQ
jgi:outer membrane protein OmpA-like peptidoglycan-associated protein